MNVVLRRPEAQLEATNENGATGHPVSHMLPLFFYRQSRTTPARHLYLSKHQLDGEPCDVAFIGPRI